MPSPTEITVPQLARLIGVPQGPRIIDVRTEEDYALDPRLIPGAVRRPATTPGEWAKDLAGTSAVVVCQRGAKLSQGAAAWLRHEAVPAESLEGGFEAWRQAGMPVIRIDKLPSPNATRRTVWVTRARPKIDRIACPWLIHRFVDPDAIFLFVAASEVLDVAKRFAATPFDVEDVFWSHRGEQCTFEVMLHELGLETGPLRRLAEIICGADTARLELAPEAAGLLAVSLGLSRMYRDDLEQLAAAMPVYDALYRWARDATGETHTWRSNEPAK